MGLLIMLIAGLFVGLANYSMRRAIDEGGNARAYILVQLFISGVINVIAGPIYENSYTLTLPTLATGILGGLFLGGMMKSLGQAMRYGPASLSVAFINASTAMPALIMYLIWGARWNFTYQLNHAFGTILVVLGLIWATRAAQASAEKSSLSEETLTGKLPKRLSALVSLSLPKSLSKWLFWAIMAFTMHTLLLCLTLWIKASIDSDLPTDNLLMPIKIDPHTHHWFLPIVFTVAWIIHCIEAIKEHAPLPKRSEIFFGTLGGMSNGVSIALLMMATFIASPIEAVMIYPLYSVSIITVCNIWGMLLYKEKIHWKASSLCMIGLIIGTVHWPSLLALFP